MPVRIHGSPHGLGSIPTAECLRLAGGWMQSSHHPRHRRFLSSRVTSPSDAAPPPNRIIESPMSNQNYDVINEPGAAPIKLWTRGVPLEDEARQQLVNI